MKKKTINLYSFNELNEEQKEKVIENYADINTNYDWHNYILEDWKEKLSRQGFEDAEINFTGFWSQGDGASFNCQVNLEKFLKGRRIAKKYQSILNDDEADLSISITNNGHYCHEYMMIIHFDDWKGLITAELEKFILEEAREQARKIYDDLYDNYEGLTSKEAIIDTLIINEYLFNEETLKIDS